jgi:hypothetical protein
MKARIKSANTQRISKRILEDEEYARNIYSVLAENSKDDDKTPDFEKWYEQVKLVDFVQKINDIDRIKRKKGSDK